MKNKDIRNFAKENGIHLWMIAEKMKIQDSAFSRKLRKELPDAEKKRIVAIIKKLAQEEVM